MPYPQQVGATTASEQRRRLDMCTRGFSDVFGDRLLMFDPGTATSLELLRFKPEFAQPPEFEAALRQRLEQTHVQDPAIAPAREVERWDGALLLVSKYVVGRRLSDLLPEKNGPMLALECIRQLVPILAALAEASHRFAHGALTIDRVVASHDGRLTIVEHPLGSAVEALEWPAAKLQSELGLAVPSSANGTRFDGRVDAVQLGMIALSLLLGRRVEAADYPANIPKLLTESAQAKGGDSWAASRLRSWLERAMQIGPRPLESARDALAALTELPSDHELRHKDPVPAASQPSAQVAGAAPRLSVAAKPSAAAPAASAGAAPAAAPSAGAHTTPPAPKPAASAKPVPPPPSDAALKAALAVPTPAVDSVVADPPSRSNVRWIVLGVAGVLAIGGGAVLGQKYFAPKPIVVQVAPPSSVVPQPAVPPPAPTDQPQQNAAAAAAPADTTAPPPAATGTTAAATAARAGGPAAAGGSRVGGMKFVTPLDLQIFENGNRIGSTNAPIAVQEGVHGVDLVNESLGYRSHETVTVKGGELATRNIPVPNGRLSINAQPWADVWIDGSPAGQTPLANIAIPIGEHSIVLRHPQLGEQRQTAVVRSDGVTRLSTNMQK